MSRRVREVVEGCTVYGPKDGNYKSNFLGGRFADYDGDRLRAAVYERRYDLQYLLYTLALHRYLRRRLRGYDYDRHFGGVCYLFLRGMRPETGPTCGIYFDRPDVDLIEALDERVRRRLAELGLRKPADYRVRLETHPAEWGQLDGVCRISISRFYRDQGVWRELEREIFPRLAERAGARGETSLREVPERWRGAFQRSDDAHCLRADYRRPVRFLEQDIRHALPESHFDLILCRNLVFTYFATSLQAAIARRLAERLTPGGMLLLGIHESLPESSPMLVQERPWLHRRREE